MQERTAGEGNESSFRKQLRFSTGPCSDDYVHADPDEDALEREPSVPVEPQTNPVRVRIGGAIHWEGNRWEQRAQPPQDSRGRLNAVLQTLEDQLRDRFDEWLSSARSLQLQHFAGLQGGAGEPLSPFSSELGRDLSGTGMDTRLGFADAAAVVDAPRPRSKRSQHKELAASKGRKSIVVDEGRRSIGTPGSMDMQQTMSDRSTVQITSDSDDTSIPQVTLPPEAPQAPERASGKQSRRKNHRDTAIARVHGRSQYLKDFSVSKQRAVSVFSMSTVSKERTRREAAQRFALMQCESKSSVETQDKRQGTLLNIVSSVYFQAAVVFVILTNVMTVGIEAEATVNQHGHVDPVWTVLECVYTSIFCGELMLRIVAEGKHFFSSQERAWNLLDCLVVTCGIAEVVLKAFWEDAALMRLSRVARLLRVIRMVRMVRFIRALRTLILSIIHTLRSVFWALLLVLMIIYGFGIAITLGVSDFIVHLPESTPESDHEDLKGFWGSLPRSMLTLFECITGGVSWHDVVIALSAVGWTYVVLFLVFISFCVFAVLNVVTGVFCQSAIESAQNDKETATFDSLKSRKRMHEKLTTLFSELDTDSSGQLNITEVEDALMESECQAYLVSLGIDVTDAWNFLKLLDNDRDGTVSLEEFIHGCMALKGEAKAVHVAMLSYDQRDMIEMMEEFMQLVDAKLTQLLKRGKGSGANQFP